jgi:thioredoxin-like negative regulator of GroEL
MDPLVEDVAKEYAGKLKVAKIDVDQASDVAARFGISALPTYVVLKKGEEVMRLVGSMGKRAFTDQLNAALG